MNLWYKFTNNRSCDRNYIPKKLHWNNKGLIEKYLVGDIIYRRIDANNLINPYLEIKLTDISHNIGTNNGKTISEPEDVLFNISPKFDIEKFTDKIPLALEIKNLNNENQYNKQFNFTCKEQSDHVANMRLLHHPENCMYPHCVFEIRLNNEEVTFDNYAKTLGVKKLKDLRTMLRDELTSMIRRKAIEQNSI